MDVGVDQAGHQRRVAEIDGLRPGGMGDGGAGGNDLLSFNQDLSGGNDAAAFDIEQARGMENDGVRGCGSLGQDARPERDAGCKEQAGMQREDAAANMVGSTLVAKMACRISGAQSGAATRITMDHTMRLRTNDPRGHLPLRGSARPFGQGQPLPLGGRAGRDCRGERRAARGGANDAGRRSAARLSAASAGALRERRSHPADYRYPRSGCLCSGSGAYGRRFSRLAALRCRDGRGAGGGEHRV